MEIKKMDQKGTQSEVGKGDKQRTLVVAGSRAERQKTAIGQGKKSKQRENLRGKKQSNREDLSS